MEELRALQLDAEFVPVLLREFVGRPAETAELERSFLAIVDLPVTAATLDGVRVDALDGPDVRARLHRRPVPGLALADRPAAVSARAIVAYSELHGAFPL